MNTFRPPSIGVLRFVTIASWALLHAGPAQALEMDAFTDRGPNLKDSAPAINAEFNKRIAKAVETGNAGIASGNFKKCLPREQYHTGYQPPQYPSSIYDPLVDALTEDDSAGYWSGGYFGTERIEDWLESSSEIDRVLVSGADSIYRDVAFNEQKVFSTALWAGVAMNSLIRIGDQRIGIDKVSHMASIGYTMFVTQRTSKQNLANTLRDASSEASTYGTEMSGVYSRGDMAANLAGYDFWNDVFFGTDPIVACENGKLVKKRDFRIEDYVTLAMDEAYNCSAYSETSPSVAASVAAKLLELGVACPLSKTKCEEMRKHSIPDEEIARLVFAPDCEYWPEPPATAAGENPSCPPTATDPTGVEKAARSHDKTAREITKAAK